MPALECPPLKASRSWAFQARAYAGPALPFRRLRTVDPGYTELLHTREATESEAISFMAGLGFRARAPYGLTLESGLLYNRINEDFARPGNPDGRVTITTVYGPGGDIIGTDTLREGRLNHFARNSYQTLDIPLWVGYSTRRGKWGFDIQAGPSLNVWFKPQATLLLDKDHGPITVDADSEVFREKLGMSWSGRLGIDYHVRPGWSLGIAPQVQYYPTPFTATDSPVEQNYLIGAVSFGIHMRL